MTHHAGKSIKIFFLRPEKPPSPDHFEYFFLSLAISFEFELTGHSLELDQ